MGFPEGSKTPVIRELKPDVWIAAGLGGMGVALGVGVGKEVAKRILNVEF
jgi:glycine/D-amino acid oxidase-like deaminating enzyme